MANTITTLNARNIKCHGCAGAAEQAVRTVPGVQEASADVATQTVTVRHREDVPRETLAKALTGAGFPAT